jgi:5'-nucleotidase
LAAQNPGRIAGDEKFLAYRPAAIVSCDVFFIDRDSTGKALKFIITNDDGYGEPGLEALIEAAGTLGSVVVAAPKKQHSFISHRVTVKKPLWVEQAGKGRFIVHGSPADCTRVALKSLAPDADWVLAGINPGANLGNDVYQSGTVAAVREAAILGVRGLAISQYVAPGQALDWAAARHHTVRVLTEIIEADLARGEFWNVNLPSPLPLDKEVPRQLCPRDRHAHTYRFIEKEGFYHYEGTIHDRTHSKGSDVDVCFSGNISITRMEI